MGMADKNKKTWKIVNTVLALEVSKGHLKWKVSDLSRLTGVNRSLIYYHLGKTKKEIFHTCFEKIADEFYGLSEERLQMVRNGRLLDCTKLSQQMFNEHPEFMIFYFKWRMKKSPIQQVLIKIEERYQKKLKSIFPSLSEKEIVSLHGLLQGLVTSPFLNQEGFIRALGFVQMPPAPKSATD